MNTTTKLEGIIPAVITPVDERGNIDCTLLEKQVAYLSTSGVHGFFVNGTTGEGAYLTTQEKIESYKLVKTVSEGKQFLCAACLQPSTELVLKEIQAFEPFEPDFIVATTPYYYAASQAVIKQHYQEIAQRATCPVIIYNIPSRTHNPVHLESIGELSSNENIAGIKDSSGDFIFFSRGIYTELQHDFAWIQGEDYLDASSLLLGAAGIVTGLGNVWIQPYLDMYHEAKKGNIAQVHAAQKRINALYEIINRTEGKVVPATKTAAMLLGRSHKWMKSSALTLCEQEIVKVKEVLQRLNVL